MKDKYLDTYQQEALQEALVELKQTKQREKLLADENKAILSAISAMSEAKNRNEIFSGLNSVLKKYISFEDFIVITRDDSRYPFKTLISTNSVFDKVEWLHGNTMDRALNGECILLFEPTKLLEFENLNSFVKTHVNSVILTGIRSEVTQSIILLIGAQKGHFSIENKETLRRFRPLIERAVIDIETKEKLQRIVEVRTTQLARAREEAELANQSKSEFLAMMSHEIRTPLNSVLGMLDILRQSTLSDEQFDALNQMECSAELLLAIISDILDLSKIESGSFQLNEQWIHLNDTVTFVISQQKQVAITKNLSFNFDCQISSDKQYWIDSTRLSQILFNLIGNAIKFTDSGSVSVSVAEENDEVVLSISDTGIGISRAKQAHLFTAFHQGDRSITRRFGGTGLGLAITKHLVEMMRGEISVKSRENEGSDFTIRIPVLTRYNQSRPVKIEHNRPNKALNLLIVEDTQSNQLVIKLILNKLGHNVHMASHGAEALTFLEENDTQIDMILMDVSMPVMDGITATRLIRKKGITIPIVALTAHALESDKDKCLDAGMDSFVSKPVRRQDIYEAIQSLIETA
ncbi:hybrid sensor histidine kinase/response regulator [Vibrio parahaemolyticus]|uniref:ATP-binding protein n=2 Tax=Vibrio parahaemolyticus TaxID=670 RepID=UPI00041F0620|nr:ATP-binding protein [Vibrio parahaemolyticus]EIF8961579.1 response regulator [Vibrio parahaemolyticus]EIO4086716.1 response regulator [Vibrio parahaemolyticus]TOL14906.1 hybrid sensor histidine kinase/response regulator [Vibrio parahaemolyticus]TOL55391.1 hybrid sensor histidine kinase/response regulator [Vibrio parahaemolyticus]HCE4733638.1 response regulator [Vibrio parahaemolyticus]